MKKLLLALLLLIPLNAFASPSKFQKKFVMNYLQGIDNATYMSLKAKGYEDYMPGAEVAFTSCTNNCFMLSMSLEFCSAHGVCFNAVSTSDGSGSPINFPKFAIFSINTIFPDGKAFILDLSNLTTPHILYGPNRLDYFQITGAVDR